MTFAKCFAPPSSRSSLSTEVITTCNNFKSLMLCAIFLGSRRSKDFGIPVLTLQKAQALVQVSPIIINVACFLLQHSLIFGQEASSQTVIRLFFFKIFLVSIYPWEWVAFTLIHAGFF